MIHTGASTITLNKDGHVAITGKTLSVNFSESIDIQSAKITIGNLAPEEGATPEQAAAATKTLDIKAETITSEAKDLIDEKAKAISISATENELVIDGQKTVSLTATTVASINGGRVEINKG